ncbi:hypothetical protein D3C84_613440 [compost metagenome]
MCTEAVCQAVFDVTADGGVFGIADAGVGGIAEELVARGVAFGPKQVGAVMLALRNGELGAQVGEGRGLPEQFAAYAMFFHAGWIDRPLAGVVVTGIVIEPFGGQAKS